MNPSIMSPKTFKAKLPAKTEARKPGNRIRRKLLLACGIFSSLLYIGMNVFIPMRYPGYSSFSQTVSELSAIGAPTRPLWLSLIPIYTVLVVAFGWGLWQSVAQNRRLRVVGSLMIINVLIGLFWPPMHQREVLAAGGGTLTDTLHIVWTMVTVPLMLLAITFGAVVYGKSFRLYSIVTILALVIFGVLTGLDAPRMESNLPTPWMGVWERINIGVYMLWVLVLAVITIRTKRVTLINGMASSL
jgi:hypothetical protein